MSFEINTVVISGNLTRDPELRSTASGTSVCSLRIAHNSRYKDGNDWKDRTHYFDVTIWKGVGEWVSKNLSKGDKIVAHGKLEWREWSDKEGNKRQSVDITAFSIVPAPKDGSGGGGGRSSDVDSGFQARSDGDFQPVPAAGGGGPVDDDIPF